MAFPDLYPHVRGVDVYYCRGCRRAFFMIRGAIAPSDLIAYLMYVSMLLTTITVIVNYVEQFQLGMTGIERFVEIMDMPDELALAAGNESPSDIHGTVDFRNVSFHYIDGKKDVLSHITLHVEAGDSVAIVGPSGSGKTTMCNLIPRFYEISSGEILIDGKDIREYTLQSLRSQIGIVQQDVYLFAGTVYENISFTAGRMQQRKRFCRLQKLARMRLLNV